MRVMNLKKMDYTCNSETSKSVNVNRNLITVRAEIITELILKRAGPVIFKIFFLELIAFRPIPVFVLQEE